MTIPTPTPALDWLPAGKKAGVCFTIDDVHPGKSTDAFEAGGDLDKGALGHVQWLLERHPKLHVTLFTTADWREISPVPTRKWLRRVPVVRDRVMLTKTLARGTMQLDRHPDFVRFLSAMPRTEVALHGLHHIHPGERVPVEFQAQTEAECVKMLQSALDIFAAAGLPKPLGMCPPGWNAPPPLLRAMAKVGLKYVASSRDIKTPITPGAKTAMSGLLGASLTVPDVLAPLPLMHIPTNFQATTRIERALDIVRGGGLLAIKGHIVKSALGYIAVDGIDGLYCNYLDLLFRALDAEFGEALWWTSMGEVASRAR